MHSYSEAIHDGSYEAHGFRSRHFAVLHVGEETNLILREET